MGSCGRSSGASPIVMMEPGLVAQSFSHARSRDDPPNLKPEPEVDESDETFTVTREVEVLLRAGYGFWLRACLWALLAAAATGIPAVMLDTPLFTRMTPTTWWGYALWTSFSVLAGMLMAARHLPGALECNVEGRALAGGGITFVAVACPICNKLVVAALGVSGAMTYFAPVQPLIGLVGLAISMASLRKILNAIGRGSDRVVAPQPNASFASTLDNQ